MLNVQLLPRFYRQEKEAWIKAKYVEKKFLKKMMNGAVVVNGGRKSERRWNTRKCRRHHSATTVPKPHRKYRQDPGSASPAALSSGDIIIIIDCLRKFWGCIMFFGLFSAWYYHGIVWSALAYIPWYVNMEIMCLIPSVNNGIVRRCEIVKMYCCFNFQQLLLWRESSDGNPSFAQMSWTLFSPILTLGQDLAVSVIFWTNTLI